MWLELAAQLQHLLYLDANEYQFVFSTLTVLTHCVLMISYDVKQASDLTYNCLKVPSRSKTQSDVRYTR